MKKITFILLALISGTAFAQATATVNAEIVQPISIESAGTALNFGSIDGGVGGGTVVLSTAGTRTADNAQLLVGGTEGVAATFEIKAADQYQYSISIPGITLGGPNGSTMDATFSQDIGGVTTGSTSGTGAVQILNVGGALTIAEVQAAGSYEGTVTVTVDYN